MPVNKPLLMIPAPILLAWALFAGGLPAGAQGMPVNGMRWTNSLGMVFVPVEGTDVLFCIHETTMRNFACFARTKPHLDGTNWEHALYHDKVPVSIGPDYPVVNVSWRDATGFCQWLTQEERRQKRIGAEAAYRLPTDTEWSVAVGLAGCESGKTPRARNGEVPNVFPWGTTFPPPSGAGNFADESAFVFFGRWPHIEGYNDGYVTTSPVGRFAPNRLGLYDMAGNALEWCQDCYEPGKPARTLRGSAWINCGPRSLWSGSRSHAGPDRFSVATGFRCVFSAKPGI